MTGNRQHSGPSHHLSPEGFWKTFRSTGLLLRRLYIPTVHRYWYLYNALHKHCTFFVWLISEVNSLDTHGIDYVLINMVVFHWDLLLKKFQYTDNVNMCKQVSFRFWKRSSQSLYSFCRKPVCRIQYVHSSVCYKDPVKTFKSHGWSSILDHKSSHRFKNWLFHIVFLQSPWNSMRFRWDWMSRNVIGLPKSHLFDVVAKVWAAVAHWIDAAVAKCAAMTVLAQSLDHLQAAALEVTSLLPCDSGAGMRHF